MNQVTRDDVIRMVKAIEVLHDAAGQFLNDSGLKPSSNSQAVLELSTFRRPESLETVYSQGTILVEVVADQLIAFTKTVTEPVQTIAPWSCLRAVIESSALANWLLDPSIDAKARVQRSFAFRYEGLSEEAKFLRASKDEPSRNKIISRIDEVEQNALELGYSKIEDKNGKRCGIGQTMTSLTDIITDTLKEEAIYRLLSAMTHAHPWAVQQLGFRQIKKEGSPTNLDPGSLSNLKLFEKHLEPPCVASLCRKAVEVFSKPTISESKLFGWNTERLKGFFNIALSSLRVL